MKYTVEGFSQKSLIKYKLYEFYMQGILYSLQNKQ